MLFLIYTFHLLPQTCLGRARKLMMYCLSLGTLLRRDYKAKCESQRVTRSYSLVLIYCFHWCRCTCLHMSVEAIGQPRASIFHSRPELTIQARLAGQCAAGPSLHLLNSGVLSVHNHFWLPTWVLWIKSGPPAVQ